MNDFKSHLQHEDFRLIEKITARRNIVCRLKVADMPVVFKRYQSESNRDREGHFLKMLAEKGISVPRIIHSDEMTLYLEDISGDPISQMLEEGATEWVKGLAEWFALLHGISSPKAQILKKVISFKDFIYADDKVYGLDFEQAGYGCYLHDIAGICCLILQNRTQDRKTKKDLIRTFLKVYSDKTGNSISGIARYILMFAHRHRINITDQAGEPAFSAVILNGGKSLRAKVKNKGFLKIGNKTILETIYAVLKDLFPEIIIISNDVDDIKKLIPEARVVPDAIESRGPMSGIYTGLLNSHAPKVFVCACDMPFIDGRLIRYLMESSNDTDLTFPVYGDRFEPLCAVYDKTCHSYLRQIISSSANPRVDALVPLVRSKLISVEHLPFSLNPDCFMNVNTPDDYRKALERADRNIKVC